MSQALKVCRTILSSLCCLQMGGFLCALKVHYLCTCMHMYICIFLYYMYMIVCICIFQSGKHVGVFQNGPKVWRLLLQN